MAASETSRQIGQQFSRGGRIRVLQVGKFYPPHRGGIESHLETLSESLHRRVDVEVVVASSDEKTHNETRRGIPVERTGTLFSIAGTPICPSLLSVLRHRQADIIHLHLPNPTATLAYLASGHKGKLVVTYHSDTVRQRILGTLFSPFQELMLSRASAILATSPQYIETSPVLRRHRDRCHLVPLGISLDPFDRPDWQVIDRLRMKFGDRMILAAGRLVYYKGFEYLIRAMVRTDGHLVVVGNGPLRPQLERLIAELGVGNKVTLTGEVEDIVPYYHAATMFAFPSIARSEAFGLVQAEAMACRKPVVNTDLPSGVPFVSLHGRTGLTVPPCDPQGLAVAMTTLLDNIDLRRQFGREARLRVEQEFTTERMTGRILSIYESVLGSSVPLTAGAVAG